MKKDSVRNSSLELLRIICMLLIIAHHYFVHGDYDEVTYKTVSAGYIFLQAFSMFGRPACSVFALISGFFMIDSACKKHYRRIVPIISQMLFYAITILTVTWIIDPSAMPSGSIFSSILPMMRSNWYVYGYCIFYLFIPFFNKWVRSMEKSEYLKFLVIALTVWSIIPTFFGDIADFCDFIFFAVMYFVGAYIKLYVHGKTSYKNSVNLYVALASAAFMMLSVVVMSVSGILFKSNWCIRDARYLQDYTSVVSVVFAVSIFLYFSNRKFESKAVNKVAATTLGIYILHDNYVVRKALWSAVYSNAAYVAFPYLHFVIKVLAVFAVGFVIDLLRNITVGRVFKTWFYKNCDAMADRLKAIAPKFTRKSEE